MCRIYIKSYRYKHTQLKLKIKSNKNIHIHIHMHALTTKTYKKRGDDPCHWAVKFNRRSVFLLFFPFLFFSSFAARIPLVKESCTPLFDWIAEDWVSIRFISFLFFWFIFALPLCATCGWVQSKFAISPSVPASPPPPPRCNVRILTLYRYESTYGQTKIE